PPICLPCPRTLAATLPPNPTWTSSRWEPSWVA
ncbi:hypothetical protein BN1708_020768, partial [Verticillium longisporum]